MYTNEYLIKKEVYMKCIIRIFLVLMIVIPTLSLLGQNQMKGKDTLIKLAQEFVTLLVKGDFESAVKDFDATMTKLSPPKKLQEVWELVIGQVGSFKKQVSMRTESVPKYDIVYVTCAFEKQTLDIKVVFNKEQRIAGQFFVPTQAPVEYIIPSYALPETFVEKDAIVGQGEWELPGTLTLPKNGERFPAVVLVHGSGPQDRDETIGPNKPFRDLAWGLASQGIAVLRYEKRTKVHNKKIVNSKNLRLTVKEESIDDCLHAVNLLKETKEIDNKKIFILGHSLGGMLIPRIAARDSEIAGFIIMSGSTRKLEDIILEQFEYVYSLDGKMSDQEHKQIDKIQEVVKKIKNLQDSHIETNRENLLGAYPEYWLDLHGYNPAKSSKNISQPMFILQGGRDYQVTEKDFEGWKAALSARADVFFKLYPTLNHLFITGKGKSSPAEYQNPGNMERSVINDIATWIKSK